jgi:hypothetical protein
MSVDVVRSVKMERTPARSARRELARRWWGVLPRGPGVGEGEIVLMQDMLKGMRDDRHDVDVRWTHAGKSQTAS